MASNAVRIASAALAAAVLLAGGSGAQDIPLPEHPRPDFERLRTPRPELKSIVTHPPQTGGAAPEAGGVNAV